MKIEFLNYLLNNGIDSTLSLNIVNLDERISSRLMMIKDQVKLEIITKYILDIIFTNGMNNSILILNSLMNMDTKYLNMACIMATNKDFCCNHMLCDQLLLYEQLPFYNLDKNYLVINFLCNINVLLNRGTMEQLRLLECFNKTNDLDLLNNIFDIATNEDLCRNYDVESQLEIISNLLLENKEYALVLKK